MSDLSVLVLVVTGAILSALVALLFAKVRAVHVLVNSRSREQDDTIRALNAANETLISTNHNLERALRAISAGDPRAEPPAA